MRSFFALLNRRSLSASLLALACCLGAGSALADEYSEVASLLRAGQWDKADIRVDKLLASNPNEPQSRFFKGVIQSEQGKTEAAIQTFYKLTQDFPELSEPYNNLAVLYAGQNQYEQARAALETAIRVNPGYATAHENLGDMYAKLAAQAYSKALQLDGGQATAQTKLNLVKAVFAPSQQTLRPAEGQKAGTQAAAPAVTSAPASTAAPTAPAVVPPPPVAKVQTASAEASTAATAAAPSIDPAIEAQVRSWAQAWEKKDMAAYYAAYSKSFRPARGLSRSDWERERSAQVAAKNKISVGIHDVRVQPEGKDKALVSFRQDYQGDALRISSKKLFTLAKEGGRWLIVSETADKS